MPLKNPTAFGKGGRNKTPQAEVGVRGPKGSTRVIDLSTCARARPCVWDRSVEGLALEMKRRYYTPELSSNTSICSSHVRPMPARFPATTTTTTSTMMRRRKLKIYIHLKRGGNCNKCQLATCSINQPGCFYRLAEVGRAPPWARENRGG